MSENIVKRIAHFITQSNVPIQQVAYIFLFWSMLAVVIVFDSVVLLMSILALETEYVSFVVFVNLTLIFLGVLVLLRISRLAGYMKLYRRFKTAKPFVVLPIFLSLLCHAVVVVTDHEWHIGEKTGTNISDSLLLVNITKRMGYSRQLPIERIAEFSQINGDVRLTELRFSERDLGSYEEHRHIYWFHKTSILEDISQFSELRELHITGYSLMYSPYSLGRIPREFCQLNKLRKVWIITANIGKIPHEVERLSGGDVYIAGAGDNFWAPFGDWLVLIASRKQD
ncbi:MAG: hypothetical protein LBH93_05990 [Chitinispirillales bacterium]|jgi:amino acid transporter|nr:hypothetical protein [Chitinispirillales bacterium]